MYLYKIYGRDMSWLKYLFVCMRFSMSFCMTFHNWGVDIDIFYIDTWLLLLIELLLHPANSDRYLKNEFFLFICYSITFAVVAIISSTKQYEN